METKTTFEVFNATTDESHGVYDTLDEARGAVAHDRLVLTGYSIWQESGNGLSHRIQHTPPPPRTTDERVLEGMGEARWADDRQVPQDRTVRRPGEDFLAYCTRMSQQIR